MDDYVYDLKELSKHLSFECDIKEEYRLAPLSITVRLLEKTPPLAFRIDGGSKPHGFKNR